MRYLFLVVALFACACAFADDFTPIGASASGGAPAIAACGDGKVDKASGEQCDDGNTTIGDGCSAKCVTEIGYTCTGAPSTCVATNRALPPQGALLYYRAQDLATGSAYGSIVNNVTHNFSSVLSWHNAGSLASGDLLNTTAGTTLPELVNPCLNGRACVDFNGPGSQVHVIDSGAFTPIAIPYTVCAVAVAVGGGGRTLLGDANGNLVWGNTTWGASGANSPLGNLTGSATNANKFDVVCTVFNNASSKIYVNGALTSGAVGGSANFTQFRIGAKSGGTLNPWQGKIAEIGVWAGSTVPPVYLNYARDYYGMTVATSPQTATCAMKVAGIGDSIMHGDGGATTANTIFLQSMLGAACVVDNFGTAGFKAADILSTWETSVRGHGYTHLLIEGGVNDMQQDTAVATAFAQLQQICTEAVADGLSVEWSTVMPWKNTTLGTWTSGRQTNTDTLNADIRGTTCPAVIIDNYARMGDTTDPALLNTFYGATDLLHPHDPGQLDIAVGWANP